MKPGSAAAVLLLSGPWQTRRVHFAGNRSGYRDRVVTSAMPHSQPAEVYPGIMLPACLAFPPIFPHSRR